MPLREFDSLQAELVGTLHGRVLEVGAGCGANLEALADDVEWTGLEPDDASRAVLRRRAPGRPVLAARCEDIPLDDGSMDAVLASYVLCSVDDLPRALGELHRVLRPGGRAVFIEHVVAAPGTVKRTIQRAATPLSRRLDHGCRWDNDPLPAIAAAGFRQVGLRRHEVATGVPLLSVACILYEGVRDAPDLGR